MRATAGVVCELSADARKRVGEMARFDVAELVEPNALVRPFDGHNVIVTFRVAEVVEIRPKANPEFGDMAVGSPPVRHYSFAQYPGLFLQEQHILA